MGKREREGNEEERKERKRERRGGTSNHIPMSVQALL